MKLTPLVLALAAFPVCAFDCFSPDTLGYPIPFAVGSPASSVVTGFGQAAAWWCLLPNSTYLEPSGAIKVRYSLNTMVVLDKYKSAASLSAAALRVASATDPRVQLDAEIKAATIIPAAGSDDEYQFRLLRYNACIALTTPPYSVPIDPLPTDYCGALPLPPVPPILSIPPLAQLTDSLGGPWTLANGFAVRYTSPFRKSIQLVLKNNDLFSLDPGGTVWWKWLPPRNTWIKITGTP